MSKQEQDYKAPMQDFFKELCKDMREETKRVRRLAEQGIIEPLSDKEGLIYNIQESKNNG